MASKAGLSGVWSHVRQASTEADPKTFKFDSKGFSALIDVHSFEPKEISVKTIDHVIVVECKHDSKEDGHGSVERHFVRKFNLPNEYDMSKVKIFINVFTSKIKELFIGKVDTVKRWCSTVRSTKA